jgi:hypothetical protein
VWKSVKRIKNHSSLLTENGGFTHVCLHKRPDDTVCWQRLKLSKSKTDGTGTWVTSPAITHNDKEHEDHHMSIAKRKAEAAIQKGREDSMQAVAIEASSLPKKKRKLTDYYGVTKEVRALGRMSRWYVYAKMHISKGAFEDPYFREMCEGFWVGNLAISSRCPIFTKEHLQKWVRAEFSIFVKYLRFIVARVRASVFGNAFSQFLHDGGTLKDHQKREALGISFIAEDWGEIMTVAIALLPVANGRDATTVELLQKISRERCGFTVEEIAASMIADRAAMTVAGHFALEEESCNMHDASKISGSAVGELTRSKNKVVVNPFPAGKKVMAAAHDDAKYFSYSTRLDELHDLAKTSTPL